MILLIIMSNSMQQVQKPALGQLWELGTCYDARTETMLAGLTLWDSKTLAKHKTLVDVKGESSGFEIIEDDALNNRFNNFDLDVSLKLSFMAGLVNVEGGAKYLDMRSSNSKMERISYKFHGRTHGYRLPMEALNGFEIEHTEVIDQEQATHVCVMIEYGASAVLTFDHEFEDEDEKKNVEGHLKIMIKSIPSLKIDGDGKVNIDEKNKRIIDKLNVKYEGDLKVTKPCTNFTDAKQIVDEIPSMLTKDTAVPIRVHLLPLSAINTKAARIINQIDEQTLDDLFHLLETFRVVCDRTNNIEKYVHVQEVLAMQKRFVSCINKENVKLRKMVKEELPKIRSGDDDALASLETILDLYYRSAMEPNRLVGWIDHQENKVQFLRDFSSCIGADRVLTDYEFALAQTGMDAKPIVQFRVILGNQENDHQMVAMEQCAKKNYPPLEESGRNNNAVDVQSILQCQQSFLNFERINKDLPDAPHFVVTIESDESERDAGHLEAQIVCHLGDGTNVPNYVPPTRPLNVTAGGSTDHSLTLEWDQPQLGMDFLTSYEVQYRIMRFESLADMEEGDVDGSFVVEMIGQPIMLKGLTSKNSVALNGQFGIIFDYDNERFLVELENGHRVSVKQNNLAPDPRESKWITISVDKNSEQCTIDNLSQLTWYEVQIRSVCSLGVSEFSPILTTRTTRILEDEYNILILGSTGVGKSTFINAFRNYLTFPTLHAAKENGLKCVIPSKFQLCDPVTGEMKVVSVKPEGNAKHTEHLDNALNEGKSCTRSCRAYVFGIRTLTGRMIRIRLIDTPGIGDTEGVSQDEKNCQMIFDFIGKYDKIHAVLFLLKPNDARMTTSFQYNIMELIQHLHRSAARNILFVMTNSQGTFYTPGDSMGPLNKLLDDLASVPPSVRIKANVKPPGQTVFCIDSESFRYLAAIQNGFAFLNSRDADFEQSWEKSVDCCRDIIQVIKSFPAHDTKETISLNDARRRILQLREPLVQINSAIEVQIQHLDHYKERIKNHNSSIEDLKKLLKKQVVRLEAKPLDYPGTVCTHEDCSDLFTDEIGTKVVYNQFCHARCYLTAPVETHPCIELQCCYAMKRNNGTSSAACFCGHSWEHHMHIKVRYDRVMKTEDDAGVAANIKTEEDALRAKKAEIARCDEDLRQLKREKEKILNATASFGHFLAHSGISPINTAFEGYIRQEITKQKNILRRLSPDDPDRERLSVLIERLKKDEQVFRDTKKRLEEAMDWGQHNVLLTAKQVRQLQEELYDLPKFGEDIKKAVQAEETVARVEVSLGDEYIDTSREPTINNQGGRRGRRSGAVSKSVKNKNNKGLLNFFFG